MKRITWFVAVAAALVWTSTAAAQEAAQITGRVTSGTGAPEAAVLVRITALNVGATTRDDGTYTLVVPASRFRPGQSVTLTASRVGLATLARTVTLAPGATLTQNFQLGSDVLLLDEVVATGQGTTTTRERVVTAISTVRAEDITRSHEPNITTALAAKAPGVNVTSSSGDPGAGTDIRVRDAASIFSGTQPLFVVDGTPISNASNMTESMLSGTAVANRAIDLNPHDVDHVEILKGAAATAIYGSRGANGVVLVTTRRGQAGRTRATLSTTLGQDEVSRQVPLQQEFGQGQDGVASTTNVRSWGPRLAPGTPVFDHSGELYRQARRLETNLTLQGGADRTTYMLGVGHLDQSGVVRGNSQYTRTTVRLKASHFFTDVLNVTGNVAYTQSQADLLQQGSNPSGVLLGALRTPPEFNNLPYRDPATGLQRAYRCHETLCTTGSFLDVNGSRGFDNPFFVTHENKNTSEIGRTFGNVAVDFTPQSWLRLNYTLGADYGDDARLTYFPNTSSNAPDGQVITATFRNFIIDSNLSLTANGTLGNQLEGSVTVGQNLNHTEFRQNALTGSTLIPGAEQPDYAVTRVPDDARSTVRTDGYFATGDFTFADQLTLSATGRLDGSSTFGGEGERFFYPSVGAAWQFSRLPLFQGLGLLSFGKLRASWGRTGRQPPVYSNTSGFQTGLFNDGWLTPAGLHSIYGGQSGVFTGAVRGNPDIRPEEKTELEVGTDLAFLDERLSLGVTYFSNRTRDVILQAPLPASSGYGAEFRNAAEFTGQGWEVSLDAIPVQGDRFSWTVGAQYARMSTCVEDLAGSDFLRLQGFANTIWGLARAGEGEPCHAFGSLLGNDWVRFGRGTVVGGKNIDEQFPDAPAGAVYVAESGRPLMDPAARVIGDPNPDWTASLRSTMTIAGNLRLSGLLDIRRGGAMWNGTKGALYSYGTHAETLPYHGSDGKTGFMDAFGRFELPNRETPLAAGPGAGREVEWGGAWLRGLGGGFSGPTQQFVEDASFVKLREITVAYTFDAPWVRRLGTRSVDVAVSGRNLHTWTDYTGIDPESNLMGQNVGRGLDFFNNPQTRSWILSVNLNR
ncbi:MAG TPA: SusC/RagA family TonB-linked outer membrane protein [Longimicrobium sp.]|nr:SusC/RagA family TonB-linked outer membrane protein [Longimicrobium sp.]